MKKAPERGDVRCLVLAHRSRASVISCPEPIVRDYAEPATLSYSTLQHRPMAYEEQSFTASAQRLIEAWVGGRGP